MLGNLIRDSPVVRFIYTVTELLAASPVLFESIRTFPRVGHGVGQRLTHILTHTVFGVFATKKHRKPKFSMLFGAAGQIRTADLILTNYI